MKTNTSIFTILKPYKLLVFLLVIFALAGNLANLVIPQIISKSIDSFLGGDYSVNSVVVEFVVAILIIFIFSLLQSITQTWVSEKVAFDFRRKISDKISRQSYVFIKTANPSKLLTNLTSDVDSLKMFVSSGVSSIVSSVFMIAGVSVFMIMINWKLALSVLFVIPAVGITFYVVLKKVRVLFRRSREAIDRLNRIINESILGAAIIRVVNSQHFEYSKFLSASTQARNIGVSIVTLFATLMPVITFMGNIATLIILWLGGHMVISGTFSTGNFAAFNSYVSMVIFPITVIGFISNLIAQATASFERINAVLNTEDTVSGGTVSKPLSGVIMLDNVDVLYDGKPVLKDISFEIKPRTRTAIIGPTAAGKTQLLYLLTGLIEADHGEVLFDGVNIRNFLAETFHSQVGFVFQDSVMFNMTLRENIAFSRQVTGEALQRAIDTTMLTDFLETLPNGLDTLVSERGTNLSGGQKQRIMLARALALNPKIILLDDFTARVDQQTEAGIMKNIVNNYPDLTLVSVTQKITHVKDFDTIILLMNGEIVASGTHETLRATCPEYVQIYESQKSTSNYETVAGNNH